MKFSNMKITIWLENQLIMNRLTTIDSILLSAYYAISAKNGKRLPYDPEHKTVDFIERKHNIFSGSIWYVDNSEKVVLDIVRFSGGSNTAQVVRDSIGDKVGNHPFFKPYFGYEETILCKKIHFYIRGSEPHIHALLKHGVDGIGKLQRLGYGRVLDFNIETMPEDDDRGYMLDKHTPSKPLPVKSFSVKTKKVAFFRPIPPYWDKNGLEACYMPTSSLVERSDKTYLGKFNVARNLDYIPNVNFLYDTFKKWEGKKFKDVEPKEYIKKKRNYTYTESIDKEMVCALTGYKYPVGSSGLVGNIREYFTKDRQSFSDYAHLKQENFISKQALWSFSLIRTLAFGLVMPSEKALIHVRGGKSKPETNLNSIIRDHSILKPPFSIHAKDSNNAQHLSFKNRVSVSNAYYFFQYGNRTLQIDAELLGEAIDEIVKITADPECDGITKSHLCGVVNTAKGGHPNIQYKKWTPKKELIIQEFKKKYDRDLRIFLYSVAV